MLYVYCFNTHVPSGTVGGLTAGQSADIERVQKRVSRIIFPNLHYEKVLERTGLDRLDTQREKITEETFETIKKPSHLLHYLLPVRDIRRDTRDSYPFWG